jgi:hypothetical protein
MADYPENPAQQLAGAWQVAVSVFGQWREQVGTATAEAKEKLDPAFHAAVEALRAAVAGNWGACRCSCATAHPQDRGVCDHNAVLMRHVSGKDVALCAPCAVAQGVAEMRR